jgi:hypothetical protein
MISSPEPRNLFLAHGKHLICSEKEKRQKDERVENE